MSRRWIVARALLVAIVSSGLIGCESKPPGETPAAPETTTPDAPRGDRSTKDAAEPTHVIVLKGAFAPGVGDSAGLPADSAQKSLADIDISDSAAAQLNEQSRTIVEQVVRRYAVEPAPSGEDSPGLPRLVITFGEEVGPDPKRPMTHAGLLVKVDLQRVDGTHRAASRQIPPATSGGELMANLDHTLGALVEIVLE